VQESTRIKRELMRQFGVRAARAFELDHVVPLELGGAPRDARNLWQHLDATEFELEDGLGELTLLGPYRDAYEASHSGSHRGKIENESHKSPT
jgi:hypothetical protein